MSSRYSICLNHETFKSRFSVDAPENYKPRYNAAPSQLLPVISSDSPLKLSFFHWGIVPDWSKNKAISNKLIHAQWDIMKAKPVFQRNLIQRRCIVPADGFYIWKRSGKKSQIPYRVILNSGEAFGIAAIWEEYDNEANDAIQTFKIITVGANSVVNDIQEEMPAILTRDGEKDWLVPETSQESLDALIHTFDADKMSKFTVSPKINSTQVDDISLVQPAPAADQFGNYSLFD